MEGVWEGEGVRAICVVLVGNNIVGVLDTAVSLFTEEQAVKNTIHSK